MHVTELHVRGGGTSSPAHRNERTVAALFLVGGQAFEPLRGRLTPDIVLTFDMTRRLRRLAGKTGARVERSVGSDRVGVPSVNLARAHMDAVDGREAVLARLLA